MRRAKLEDERGSSGSGRGSSWISYSDMMASLLLVFLLMLCVSLLQYFTAPKQEDLDRQARMEEQMQAIENREAELKALETKLTEKETELDQREAQLAEREKAAAEKEAELKALEAELTEIRKQLKKDQAALKTAQEQLEKEQAALKAAQEQLKKDKTALKAAQEQLEKDQTALKAAQEQLAKDQATLKAAQELLEKDLTALKAAQVQLEKDQAALKAAQEQLEKDQAALKIAQEQLAKDQAALKAAQEQLEKERAELKEERKLLDEERAALNIEKEQLEKDRAEMKTAREQLEKDQEALKAAQERLEKDREQLEAEKQAVDALQSELKKRLEELATPTPTPIPTSTQTPTPTPTPTFTPAPTPEPAPTTDPAEIERQLAELKALQEQQAALENFSVRNKIISSQFSAFSGSGLQISIDADTGEIILANSILFDAGSDVIRPEGKEFLNEFIPVYLDVLMNPEYEGYISEVIIEGHTDPKGSYIGNLSLSQSRAGNVMEYCLKVPGLSKTQKEFLQSMVSATGRGSAEPVYGENGEVDTEACRRVEFKFRMRETGILAGTGIIEELTQVFSEAGLEVAVDEDTGDIRLNSTIMFDTNSAEVKAEGRAFIQRFLPIYLDVLMKPEYQEYIGVIIIEGYTDNKGTYVANLDLSQRRAVNVLQYCLQLDLSDAQIEYLRRMITATGRSFANLVYKENGEVDMEASRRVVFKFRLKDTKSLDELMEMIHETPSP